MPGSLYTDCVYDVRDVVPIPGVLPQQNIMHGKWNSPPLTAWEWVCTQVATSFEQALQTYKTQATPALTAKMANAGCKTQQPAKGDTALRFLCDNWEGLGACKAEVAALGGQDDSGHCGLDGTKAATKLAAQIAAQLGAKRCAVSATNSHTMLCTRPWKVGKCKALVEQAQGGSVGWAWEVSCLAQDDPQFIDGQAQVLASGPVQLGTFPLLAGKRRVSLMIIGKHAQSSGYFVGIDKLRLYPAGPIE